MQPGEDLLIHIGYPKSGSTYLQDVISPRPDIRELAGTAPRESDALREALTVLSHEKLSGKLDGAHPDTRSENPAQAPTPAACK